MPGKSVLLSGLFLRRIKSMKFSVDQESVADIISALISYSDAIDIEFRKFIDEIKKIAIRTNYNKILFALREIINIYNNMVCGRMRKQLISQWEEEGESLHSFAEDLYMGEESEEVLKKIENSLEEIFIGNNMNELLNLDIAGNPNATKEDFEDVVRCFEYFVQEINRVREDNSKYFENKIDDNELYRFLIPVIESIGVGVSEFFSAAKTELNRLGENYIERMSSMKQKIKETKKVKESIDFDLDLFDFDDDTISTSTVKLDKYGKNTHSPVSTDFDNSEKYVYPMQLRKMSEFLFSQIYNNADIPTMEMLMQICDIYAEIYQRYGATFKDKDCELDALARKKDYMYRINESVFANSKESIGEMEKYMSIFKNQTLLMGYENYITVAQVLKLYATNIDKDERIVYSDVYYSAFVMLDPMSNVQIQHSNLKQMEEYAKKINRIIKIGTPWDEEESKIEETIERKWKLYYKKASNINDKTTEIHKFLKKIFKYDKFSPISNVGQSIACEAKSYFGSSIVGEITKKWKKMNINEDRDIQYLTYMLNTMLICLAKIPATQSKFTTIMHSIDLKNIDIYRELVFLYSATLSQDTYNEFDFSQCDKNDLEEVSKAYLTYKELAKIGISRTLEECIERKRITNSEIWAKALAFIQNQEYHNSYENYSIYYDKNYSNTIQDKKESIKEVEKHWKAYQNSVEFDISWKKDVKDVIDVLGIFVHALPNVSENGMIHALTNISEDEMMHAVGKCYQIESIYNSSAKFKKLVDSRSKYIHTACNKELLLDVAYVIEILYGLKNRSYKFVKNFFNVLMPYKSENEIFNLLYPVYYKSIEIDCGKIDEEKFEILKKISISFIAYYRDYGQRLSYIDKDGLKDYFKYNNILEEYIDMYIEMF